MKKSILCGACLAVLAAGSLSQAAEGLIPSKTLNALGLGGATVVSDTVAAEVRGMGYAPSPSVSIAAGGSFAVIGDKHGHHGGAAAGTVNVYFAKGQYAASGANFSEAGLIKVHSEVVTIDGITKSVTTTKSTRVYAGGFSSAMSF